MKEIIAESWAHLDECLWEKSYDTSCEKYRPYTAFRGVPRIYGNLKTSLQRMGGDINWKEPRLIDRFRACSELSHSGKIQAPWKTANLTHPMSATKNGRSSRRT